MGVDSSASYLLTIYLFKSEDQHILTEDIDGDSVGSWRLAEPSIRWSAWFVQINTALLQSPLIILIYH